MPNKSRIYRLALNEETTSEEQQLIELISSISLFLVCRLSPTQRVNVLVFRLIFSWLFIRYFVNFPSVYQL